MMRVLRLIKAFATLDDRPLDASGRPIVQPEPAYAPPLIRRKRGC